MVILLMIKNGHLIIKNDYIIIKNGHLMNDKKWSFYDKIFFLSILYICPLNVL